MISAEDFIRGYLLRHNFLDTLYQFQKEYNEREDKPVSIQLENVYEQLLQLEKDSIEKDHKMELNDLKMKENDKMYLEVRKERDLFKSFHNQFMQDKKKSDVELKKVKGNIKVLEDQITAMQSKVIKYEREKLNAQRELENIKNKDKVVVQKLPALPTEVPLKPVSNEVPKDVQTLVRDTKSKKKAWRQRKSIKAHKGEINALLFDKDLASYFTFSDDGTCKIFDLNLTEKSCLVGHDGHVTTGALYQAESLLFSADSLGIIKLWSIGKSECIHTFKPSQSEIWTMNINQCNLIFGKNSTASVWDINKLELVRDFNNHTSSVSFVNFIDSNIFYSCGIDKKLILQDLRSAYPVQSISHKYPLLTGNFYGNGILTADGSGNVYRYDLRYINEMLVGTNPARLSQTIDFGEHAIHKCLVKNIETVKTIQVGEDVHELDVSNHPGLLYAACNDGYIYS